MDAALITLCITVFIGRVVDVALSTMYTLFLVKGNKWLAVLLGFIDVIIWFLVVREALTTESSSIWIAISYAGGFATGSLIGSIISSALINSNVLVQITTRDIDNKVTDVLREKGYSASIIESRGLHKNEVNYLIHVIVNGKKLKELKELVLSLDKDAFITVTESKENLNGYLVK